MQSKTYTYYLAILLTAFGLMMAAGVKAAGTNVTWDGSTSTDWDIGSNWSNNQVPGVDFMDGNITIPDGLANYPVISNARAVRTIATLEDGASISGAGAITPSSNSNMAVTGTATISCVLAGTITYTKSGTGTLILAGNNTFSNTLTVSAGTLKLGANGGGTNGPLGTTAAGTTISNGATFDLNGFTLGTAEALSIRGTGVSSAGALTNTGGNATYSGLLTLAGSITIVATTSGTLTLDVASGNAISGSDDNITFAGAGDIFVNDPISNTTADLIKQDAGTLTLSAANTYSGATTINAGTIKAGATANILGTSELTIRDGATLDLDGYSVTLGTELTVSGTSTGGILTTGSGTLTLGGQITTTGTAASISGKLNLGGATRIIATGSSPNALTLSAIIEGADGIEKTGTGTLTLSGASTYSGTTTLTAGTIKLGASSSAATAGPLGSTAGGTVVTSGRTLDLNGFSLSGADTEALSLTGIGIGSIGALTSTGGSATYAGDITLAGATTIEADASTTLTLTGDISGNVALILRGLGNGVLSGVRSGNGSATIVINDGGTWTLSGGNSYAGVTTITLGILKLGAAGNGTNSPLGTIGTGTTIASGATLDLNGFTLSTLEAITQIQGTGVSSAGAITNTGADATFGGAITTNGATTIVATTSGKLTLSGNIDASSAFTLRGDGNGELSGIRSSSGAIVKDDAGIWIVSNANTYSGATTITAGTLRLGASSSVNTAGPLGTSAGGVTVASGAALDLAGFSLSGAANDVLSLTGTGIGGLGALTNSASTPSSYIGIITFAAGSSVVGEGGLVNITGTPFSSTNGFIIGGSAGGSISTVVAGARTITKEGTGTWTLSNANTYSGATTISAGTLKLGNAAALGTSSVTSVTSGAVLDLNGTTLSTARPVTLNGTGLAASPAGALTNTGSNASYSGDITLGSATTITATSSGTLTCSGTVGTGAFALTLDGGTGSNGTMSGIMSTPTSINKNGVGTWTLSATNTYTGATSINAGTLKLNNTAALGTSSSTTVSSGAVLDLNGITLSTARPITLNGTGLTASPAGALTNTGGNASYSGAITLGAATTITATTSGTLTCSGTVGTGAFALTLDGATSSSGTLSGIISTPTSLVKNGGGSWTLSGVNTYTGATTVNAGTLAAGVVTQAFGLTSAVTLVNTAGAMLDITGFNNTIGSITGGGASGGNVTLGAATLTIGSNNTSPAAYGGIISGSGGALIKNGSGALTLSGNNTFTGGVTLNAGTLNINHASALGGSGTFTIAGGSINNTSAGDITTNNYALSLSGDFAYTGSVPRNLNLGTGTVTMSASRQITVGAGTLTIGGVINNNTQNITKAGAGTLSFGSQAVTLNSVAINAGTLVSTSNTLSIANTFSNSGTFTPNSGTVNYNAAGAQNITVGPYHHLTCSNSGTKTASGNLVVDGTLTVGASNILDMTSAYTLGGTLSSIANSGTIRTSVPTTTSATPLATGKTWNGLVNYAATAGLQTVVSGIYTNVTMSHTTDSNTMGGSVTIGGLLTLSGGKLHIGSNTLTLNGTTSGMTSSSSLSSNASSSLSIGGSGPLGTSLFFNQNAPGTTNRLVNLTYNRTSATGGNAITLGNALQVTGTVTPTTGEVASGGNLTLVSNASGTANIADGGCTSCAYLTGNVNVQRFIPSVARRYRFMGSTVQSTTLDDWQDEIYITGAGGAGNGFDATSTNAPSIYWYDETMITGNLNTGWTASSNTTNAITVGKGYRVFIRGDRSNTGRLTGTVNDQNAVTMDLVGTPNQGNISIPLSLTKSGSGGTVYDQANDGWNMVSNPYPSGYNWNAHYDDSTTHANIEPVIWTLSGQSGGYVSYNAWANAGSLSSGIIPGGASFWVKANNTNAPAPPTLTFKEQYKITSAPLGIFKTNEGENFNIRLYYDSITYDDAIVKYMAGSTVNYDAYDIRKLAGTVTLSVYGNDNVHLDLSVRPPNMSNDTIKLYVTGAVGAYTLQFNNSNEIAVAENVFLFDTYLSTITDLKDTSTYPFNILTGVPASSGLNRFYIVISNDASLPVNLLQFSARKTNNKQVQLNWSTAQETNSQTFEVERSADGKQYHTITAVAAGGNTNKLINYSALDEQPLRSNYYRLKQVDIDGSLSYSKVQYVLLEEIAGAKVYPVPAQKTLTIEHDAELTHVNIFTISGSLVGSYAIGAGAGLKTTVDVEKLKAGVYIIEYTDEKGNIARQKFTKE